MLHPQHRLLPHVPYPCSHLLVSTEIPVTQAIGQHAIPKKRYLHYHRCHLTERKKNPLNRAPSSPCVRLRETAGLYVVTVTHAHKNGRRTGAPRPHCLFPLSPPQRSCYAVNTGGGKQKVGACRSLGSVRPSAILRCEIRWRVDE